MARIICAAFILLLLLGAILIFSSIAGFWGGGYMIAAAIVVIVTWGVLSGLIVRTLLLAFPLALGNGGDSDKTLLWSSRLFLIIAIHSMLTGLGLGFLSFVGCGCYWLPSLYHWVGLVCAVVSFLMYFLLPWLVRTFTFDDGMYSRPFRLWVKIVVPIAMVLIWGLVWLIPYLVLRGSITETDYLAANRVYKLPFPSGESSWVIQGNNSGSNHSGQQKYAWDFRRPCDTPVLAARDGTILKVSDGFDGVGGANNNEIQISQGSGSDASVAFYFHIKKGSVPAKFRTVGALVKQGQEIAKVGSVGNSLTGHIHFMVKKSGSPLAVSFTDVKDDKGIPRTFSSYTSGNRTVP